MRKFIFNTLTTLVAFLIMLALYTYWDEIKSFAPWIFVAIVGWIVGVVATIILGNVFIALASENRKKTVARIFTFIINLFFLKWRLR